MVAATLEREETTTDAAELLWHWVREGWHYRGIGNRPRKEQKWFEERVRYEMNLIGEKDFSDFFLATSDALRWAKDHGIAVGPGRGSAAASVVCYLTRITEIDPYMYPGLVFERFMDVTRTDEPDIDVDIEDDRRWEVRQYMEEKYGPECVGTIANFVRYRGRNALKDVAWVHNVPPIAYNTVKNLIIDRSGGDSRFDASLADTAEMFPNAAAIFEAFPALWLATRLEGNVRGMSVHAAGLVVANSPLTDICAVYQREDKKSKTVRKVLSIDKYDVGYAGMLKLDMLGLTTLGIIARCIKLVGLTLEDLYAVPDTDEATLDVFRRNDVTGVFQFEGRATRIVCGYVVPDNFAQVADVNALSRPGPLFSGTTGDYVETKHGRKKRERYHPIVDEITAPTFGCIVYQEQILRILQLIGGFDWTNLNAIRNIIAKKAGQAALHANMTNFQDGALKLHGIKPEKSELIWKRLVTSGTYAFNIAHAISYSKLAWWTAYLKANYPTEFYASALSKAKPGGDGEFRLMRDARKRGIQIMPPDFRYSAASWGAVMPRSKTPGVLAGFTAVPGIGDSIAQNVVEARAEKPFLKPMDMTRARGMGTARVQKLLDFCDEEDPFGLELTGKIIGRVLDAIKRKEIPCPMPTHDGAGVEKVKAAAGSLGWSNRNKGERLIYAGIVKARVYQDIVENIHSRTGDDFDKIMEELKDPHLREYCTLQCFDATEHEVYLRGNRYVFPKVKGLIETIEVGHDVVICIGRKSPGFGISMAIDRLYVIDPD